MSSARSLPRRAWRRVSAGTGAKGQRWYSWALVDITGDTDTGHHHLLIRRNDKTGELAYYRCYSPDAVTFADYVRVAGWRWKIEETFQTGKGLAGLDEHQVRTWTSWHRWVTLALLAHAFLAVTTAAQRRTEASGSTRAESLITLTVNEFRRLFVALLLRRPRRSPTSWPGRPGGENTKPEPAPAARRRRGRESAGRKCAGGRPAPRMSSSSVTIELLAGRSRALGMPIGTLRPLRSVNSRWSGRPRPGRSRRTGTA